jgi:UDP-N-acetylglucosamine--N-acetylmuramyl-(pentapeptide) pyrophosphoryl-undecaprenol N-acetylglucosamine transferase
MDLAYGAADLVVSRAGAIAISEIALAGKPAVFIPLPTAAENHQLKNALALKEKEAAWVIDDKDAKGILAAELKKIIDNKELCNVYAQNIRKTGIPDAAARIVNEIEQIMR